MGQYKPRGRDFWLIQTSRKRLSATPTRQLTHQLEAYVMSLVALMGSMGPREDFTRQLSLTTDSWSVVLFTGN
jgi:hypothetical protein